MKMMKGFWRLCYKLRNENYRLCYHIVTTIRCHEWGSDSHLKVPPTMENWWVRSHLLKGVSGLPFSVPCSYFVGSSRGSCLFYVRQTDLCWILPCSVTSPALPRILSSGRTKHDISPGALGLHQVKSHYKLLWEALKFSPRTPGYWAINNRQPHGGLNHMEFIFHLTRKPGSESPGVLRLKGVSLLPILHGWALSSLCPSWSQDAAPARASPPPMTLCKAGRERRWPCCSLV